MSGERLDPSIAPIIAALRDLMRDKHVTQAAVEERAGLPKKYLSRLLNGHVDMKLVHLMAVLAAAEIAPAELFSRLAGVSTSNGAKPPAGDPRLEETVRRLERRVEHLERATIAAMAAR